MLRQSPSLSAALLVSVLTIGGVAAAVVLRPDAPRPTPAPGRAAAAATSELATILAAPDATRFVGRVVQWHGTLKELSAERDRLLVQSDGQFFAARCGAPVGQDVSPGSRVQVQGAVIERTQGVVVLQGRSVKLLESPTPGAAPRR